MANDGSGANWDEAAPANNEYISNLPREIRDERIGNRIRVGKEHVDPAAASVGGEHIAGSAFPFVAASAPTLRPDGVTSLDSSDAGRLWLDTTPTIPQLKRWTGTVWKKVGEASWARLIQSASGALTAATWVTRTISSISSDVDTIITSLAANKFTLPAGRYKILVVASAYKTDKHRAVLCDNTGAVAGTVVDGVGGFASNGDSVQSVSLISGEFTLASATALHIEHYADTTVASVGQGNGYAPHMTIDLWRLN